MSRLAFYCGPHRAADIPNRKSLAERKRVQIFVEAFRMKRTNHG